MVFIFRAQTQQIIHWGNTDPIVSSDAIKSHLSVRFRTRHLWLLAEGKDPIAKSPLMPLLLFSSGFKGGEAGGVPCLPGQPLADDTGEATVAIPAWLGGAGGGLGGLLGDIDAENLVDDGVDGIIAKFGAKLGDSGLEAVDDLVVVRVAEHIADESDVIHCDSPERVLVLNDYLDVFFTSGFNISQERAIRAAEVVAPRQGRQSVGTDPIV